LWPAGVQKAIAEILAQIHEDGQNGQTSMRRFAPDGASVGAVSAMLDKLLHHDHVLKYGPRSWRTKNPENLQPEQPLT